MKNLSIILLAAGAIIFTGCKDKDKEEELEPTPTANGTLNFHFHHIVDAAPFAFNTDYTDDFGTMYQFSRADWYFAVPGFLEHDNSTSVIDQEMYFKLDPGVTMLTYGEVAPGEYHNMRWGIGVDSVTNHLDPNTYETGDALANQSPSMHWGWSTGYIFCALEGLVDEDGSGTYDAGETFTFHIGTDTCYREGMNLHVDVNVAEGGTGTIHLDVNYAKFFEGIDLSTENSTHTMSDLPLALKVADNFDQVLNIH